MKYVFLLIILLICGLAYIHADQPELWNKMVKAVGLENFAVVPDKTAPSDNSSATGTSAATALPTAPPAPSHSNSPELISPSSTNFINPDHVHQVEQPIQPAANTNQPGNPPAQ